MTLLSFLNFSSHIHRNGYGSPINIKFGEVTLKDLLEQFSSGTRRFTGYFTHDTMIEMIFCALGLFKDYPQINSEKRDVNRKWRISVNAPFASNFVAVLNR